jgi:hypothetical protein
MQAKQYLILAAVMVALANAGGASAQAPTPGTAPVAGSSQPESTKAKTWTKTQWNSARRNWAQNKAKYQECQGKLRTEAKAKRLKLNDRRNFLSSCMSG